MTHTLYAMLSYLHLQSLRRIDPNQTSSWTPRTTERLTTTKAVKAIEAVILSSCVIVLSCLVLSSFNAEEHRRKRRWVIQRVEYRASTNYGVSHRTQSEVTKTFKYHRSHHIPVEGHQKNKLGVRREKIGLFFESLLALFCYLLLL